LRFPTALLVLLVLALPATAGAAPRFLPPVEKNLAAAKAKKRTCVAQLSSARKRGIDRTAYTAPMSGFVNVRLSGARRGDWDLAVFDAKTKRALASSQGFSSDELAQTWVTSGQRLAIQGCRRSGRARRANVSIQLVDIARTKSAGAPRLLRVNVKNGADLQRLEGLGLDVTHQIHDGHADVIAYGPQQRSRLDKAGFSFKTVIADMNEHFAASRAADRAFTRRVGANSALPSGRTTYRNLLAYQTDMKALVDKYPDRIRPVTLPKQTTQGRPIEGIEIASDVKRPEDGRPTWFVVAMHHAREWPSGEIAMETAIMLAEQYGKDPRVTNLVDNARIVIVPIINVDSFVFTQAAFSPADTFWYGGTPAQPIADQPLPDGTPQFPGQDVGSVPYTGEQAVGAQAYRRKTCSGAFPAGSPCEIQYGTDPNRNYAEGWGGIGASSSPHDLTYRGPGPWSEPETQAVHEFSQTRQVTNIITIHNVAALVLRPPGRKADGLAPDEDRMREIGDAMADATGYRSQYGWQLYDTSGTTEDWNYAAQGAYGYTIEVGPGSDPTETPENVDPDASFHMPYERGVVREWTGWGPNEGQGLREAMLIAGEAAINNADHSIIKGTAPAGRVLRLRKEFQTQTDFVCRGVVSFPVYFTGGPLYDVTTSKCVAPGDRISIDDHLDTTMVVPKSGRFVYHANPSTRPFKRYRYVPPGAETSIGKQDFAPKEGEAPSPAPSGEPGPENYAEREFTVGADAAKAVVTLEAATPAEDYDLYLWRKAADGSLQPAGVGPSGDAGQSANAPPSGEQIDVTENVPGDYVMRIVNYAAEGTTWTATVETFDGGTPAHYEEVGRESWTLTCESRDGKTVYDKRSVFVDRGESVNLNLPCGGAQTPSKPGPTGGTKPPTGGNRPGAKNQPGADNQAGRKKLTTAQKIKKAKKRRAACLRKARARTSAKRRKAAKRACKRTYRRKVRRIRARAS
jgi:hypothetical protein